MTGRATRAIVLKEFRELGPLWILGASILTLMAVVPGRGPDPISVVTFTFVALGLGATSMGHEYRRHTLGSLLAQPVGRQQLLIAKTCVLAALLLALLAVPWGDAASAYGMPLGRRALLVPLAAAFCLAPWFTMATRSELAGMAFAGALPAMLWIGAQVAAIVRYGMTPHLAVEANALRDVVFTSGFVVMCAVSAIATVYAFLRLEVPDTGGHAVGGGTMLLPSRPRLDSFASHARRHSPYLWLVSKELRLYQLPAAVAVMFAIAWVVLTNLEGTPATAIDIDALIRWMSGFYALLVTVLVGRSRSPRSGRWACCRCRP